MFVDYTYLHIYDNEYDDEMVDEDHFEESWIVDMCGLLTLDTSPNVGKKKDHNHPSSSSSPTKKMFV
jgi:hypothetical protein